MDIAGLFGLEGRRALVTGASGVLGGHFARVLHGAGAAVALAARRVDAVPALGARSVAVPLDVTDAGSIAAAFDAAEAALGGPCDIIIHGGHPRARGALTAQRARVISSSSAAASP